MPKLREPTGAELERVARLAARRGAAIIRKYYETDLRIDEKGEVNLVTRADVESQQIIVKTLSRAFPHHAILAEEDADGHAQSMEGPIWIIDPLDGTTNFAHGFPMFGISIAFRNCGKTRFGLVYQPILRELFIAHRGQGATRNGRPIHVSRHRPVAKALLATGFPYDRRTSTENNLNLFCRFEMAALCVRRAGAAAVDLAYIACGRYDGFWEPKLSPWDIAAGTLLVEEAGGRVTTYNGGRLTDLRCGEIVASNRLVHKEMLEIISTTRQRIRVESGTDLGAVAL